MIKESQKFDDLRNIQLLLKIDLLSCIFPGMKEIHWLQIPFYLDRGDDVLKTLSILNTFDDIDSKFLQLHYLYSNNKFVEASKLLKIIDKNKKPVELSTLDYWCGKFNNDLPDHVSNYYDYYKNRMDLILNSGKDLDTFDSILSNNKSKTVILYNTKGNYSFKYDTVEGELINPVSKNIKIDLDFNNSTGWKVWSEIGNSEEIRLEVPSNYSLTYNFSENEIFKNKWFMFTTNDKNKIVNPTQNIIIINDSIITTYLVPVKSATIHYKFKKTEEFRGLDYFVSYSDNYFFEPFIKSVFKETVQLTHTGWDYPVYTSFSTKFKNYLFKDLNNVELNNPISRFQLFLPYKKIETVKFRNFEIRTYMKNESRDNRLVNNFKKIIPEIEKYFKLKNQSITVFELPKTIIFSALGLAAENGFLLHYSLKDSNFEITSTHELCHTIFPYDSNSLDNSRWDEGICTYLAECFTGLKSNNSIKNAKIIKNYLKLIPENIPVMWRKKSGKFLKNSYLVYQGGRMVLKRLEAEFNRDMVMEFLEIARKEKTMSRKIFYSLMRKHFNLPSGWVRQALETQAAIESLD